MLDSFGAGVRKGARHPSECWIATLTDDKHLRELIDKMRAMAVRYRKWADQADPYHADEFLKLADSSEQSADDLEEILRGKSGA